MDADYKLARNEPYNTNTDAEGNEVGTNYKSFTSTIAGAFVKKDVALLAGAKVLIHVPYGSAQRAQRAGFDMKERFGYGALEQADDELMDLVQISIHDQQAWYAANRGWLVGLGIMRNTEEGATRISVRPWDALNSFWQVGSNGLAWACQVQRMTLADARAEWPDATLSGQDDEEREVYDFWTPTENVVFTSEKEQLKKFTAHGGRRVPVVVVPVPNQPAIWSENIANTADDYGESVLATNRSVYPYISEVMSILLDLLGKAREPSNVVFTDEEDTELPENPNEGKGTTYLGREDKFQQLLPPEATKDAMNFVQAALGMVQRGDLPFTSYGEIQFALSGYAITQLNQQLLTVIGPQTRALSRWYKGILDLLVDQFTQSSNPFWPIEIRTAGNNQDYMQTVLVPEMLLNLPPFRVEVVAELPQDDVAKLNAVQLARNGPVPFLPDRYLRDNYIKAPNADLIDQQLKEQQAERASPRAAALVLAQAALEAGRPDLAKVYIDEMVMQTVQLELQKAALFAPPQAGAGGVPSQVMPFIQGAGGQRAQPNPPTGEEGRFGLGRQS